MTWLLTWLNESVATLKATLQLLVLYWLARTNTIISITILKHTNMEDILLFSSLTLFLLFIAFKFILKTRTRAKHLPPSPPSLPIIDHLHLIKKPLHRTLQALSQKYGNIFSLQFGRQPMAILSSPLAVEECFTKNNIVLANRPSFISGKHLGYNNTSLVQSPYGHH